MDEEEKIEYSYTGDVSLLREATEEAINLLDKYDSALKKVASTDGFKASKTSVQGFQRSINSVIKNFNALSSYLNKVSAENATALTPETDTILNAYMGLSDTLDVLNTKENIVSKDLQKMSAALKSTSADIGLVASKAQVLGTTLAKTVAVQPQKVVETANQVVAAVEQVATAVEPVSVKVKEVSTQTVGIVQDTVAQILAADRELVQNAPFLAYAQQLEQQLSTTSKSAKESMEAMFEADPTLQYQERIDTTVNNIVNKVNELRSNVASRVAPITEMFNRMAQPFQTVSANVQSFRDRVATSLSYVAKLTNDVSEAFRRVSGADADSAEAAEESTEAHKGLANVLDKLRNLLGLETKSIEDEEEELDEKNDTLDKSREAHQRLRDALNRLGNVFRSETSRLTAFNSRLNITANVSNLARRALIGLTGVRIGEWLAEAVKQSIAYVENLNLFTVAMGRSVDMGKEFVATMSEIYGMDPSNLYRYAGYYYQLTDAIGMTSDAGATLSVSLTKAANDIASLFNVDIETVVENLASGMQGMSRAVRKYGMDIRAVTLQETANALGIEGKVQKMSEANRMALRYLTMLNQVKNATRQVTNVTEDSTVVLGDFARNIETPANQLRIFKEQVSQLARAIGNFFIPVLRTVLPLLNGFIMALRTALQFLAAFMAIDLNFGGEISGFNDEARAIVGVGAAAEDAAASMQKMVAPFDELNVLQESSGDGGGAGVGTDTLDPALLAAISETSLELENIRMKANQVRDSLLEFFGFNYTDVLNPDTGELEKKLEWLPQQFEKNLINKFPQWTQTITAVFDNWSGIVDGFGQIFGSLGGVFDIVKEKIGELLAAFHFDDDSVATFISELPSNLTAISDWIDEHAEDIANFVLTVGALAVAFRALSVIGTIISFLTTLANIIGPVLEVLSALGSVLAGVSTGTWLIVAAVGAAVAVLVYLWNTSESFRKSIQKGVDTLIKVLTTFWETTLKPIVGNIWRTLQDLWNNAIKPIIKHVIDIIGDLIELVMALWNNVLGPIINWLVKAFGPLFAEVFNGIWNIVAEVIEDILQALDGLLQVLDGIIEFLVGVFTGDWEKAWHGLVNILVGVGNTIISVFELVLNGVINLVNLAIGAIVGGIRSLINLILGAVEGVAELLGYDLNITLQGDIPKIPKVEIPRIPMMARGGVVTSPTVAMIGEGRYDEAVIPLGNSPQVSELVEKIADAIDKKPDSSGGSPVDVHVYIGGEEYDAFTYRAAERGKKLVGAQPVKIGE